MMTVHAIGQTLPKQNMPVPTVAPGGVAPRALTRTSLELIGQSPTPVVRSVPVWLPRDFSLADMGTRVRALLIEQGESERSLRPDGVRHVAFMDLDGTLVDSKMPVALVHKETGESLRYPDTGELIVLGVGADRSYRSDLNKLKERYHLPWDDYELNFDHGGDLEALLAEDPIPDQILRLRRNLHNSRHRAFVITARSAAPAASVAHEYLSRLGADVDGVVAGNTPRAVEVLGFERFELGDNRTARRKAMAMAGVISLYGAHNLDTVEFHDDSDRNLTAAMQLLPALFPNIRFRFHDVVHQRAGYERTAIAEAHGGVVRNAGGRPMSDADIADYRSNDAPWVPEPGSVVPERG